MSLSDREIIERILQELPDDELFPIVPKVENVLMHYRSKVERLARSAEGQNKPRCKDSYWDHHWEFTCILPEGHTEPHEY